MRRPDWKFLIASIVLASLLGALGPSLARQRHFGDQERGAPSPPLPGQLEVELRATLTATPDDLTALLALADLYAHTGRIQEAIPLFERAIGLRPDLLTARLSYARALLANGYLADAEAQLQAALNLAPRDTEVLYLLGELAEQRQPPDLEHARIWYQRAAESGDDAYARLARQRLQELSGGS